VVYISKDQMDELQFILSQAEIGVHVLFENHEIKKVFSKTLNLEDNIEEVEKLMEEFIAVPSISGKKFYFDALDENEKDIIIRSYFNIIENNILAQGRLLN